MQIDQRDLGHGILLEPLAEGLRVGLNEFADGIPVAGGTGIFRKLHLGGKLVATPAHVRAYGVNTFGEPDRDVAAQPCTGVSCGLVWDNVCGQRGLRARYLPQQIQLPVSWRSASR